jgi:hypothetical protein
MITLGVGDCSITKGQRRKVPSVRTSAQRVGISDHESLEILTSGFPLANRCFPTAFDWKNPFLVTNNLDRGYGTLTMESCATESAMTWQLRAEDSLGGEEWMGNEPLTPYFGRFCP